MKQKEPLDTDQIILRIATILMAVLVLVALGMFLRAAVMNARARANFKELSGLVVRTTPGPTAQPPTASPVAEIHVSTAPTAEPTPAPTVEPAAEPTAEPTEEPAAEPTPEPTDVPKAEPTAESTPEPTAEPTAEPTPEPTPVATLGPLADYEALYVRNPDFFGWISVEGTNVDLPVMYNPKMPLQYLGHDFDGKLSYAGVPFLEPECDPDGNYYLIYGHHMRDGTVFAELLKYEDPDFWAQHPTFRCDTRFEHRTYAVIAAFRARVLTEDEPGFRYYNYSALSDEETFQEFITNVRAMAAYDTGVEAVFGDDILTLSTCAYHTRLGRFVIVAKRVVE